MNYFKLVSSFFKLRKNNDKSHTELEELRQRKLTDLLLYAYDNSAYYKKAFEQAGIYKKDIPTRPLSDFPTIDKTALLENFDEIITVSDITQEELRAFDENTELEQKTFKGKYHVVHSSGSTGKPGFFVYDEHAWGQMLLGIIRGALWDMSAIDILKLLIARPRIAYIAATDGRYGGAMAVGGGIEGLKMQQLFLDIKTPLPQWISSIEKFQPNVIIGYPSAIKILAELKEQGKSAPNIIRVISCGEPLGGNMRRYFEQVFASPVINIYGASESLALGVESTGSDGMVLFDDMNYIEVQDGVMYLTSLYNYAQPLIRYQISDKLVIQPRTKEEKLPFTKVESIVGRNEDLLWFTNEQGEKDFLHPLAIEGFCVEGLVDYQFHQTGENAFEMIAEVPNLNLHSFVEAEMMRDMVQILEEKQLSYVDFSIRFVDTIAAEQATGKKRLII